MISFGCIGVESAGADERNGFVGYRFRRSAVIELADLRLENLQYW
jgi:hypothetical protein